MKTKADELKLGDVDTFEVWRIGHPDPNYHDMCFASTLSSIESAERWIASHPIFPGSEWQIVRQRISRVRIANARHEP
jgi:hypothetical protein